MKNAEFFEIPSQSDEDIDPGKLLAYLNDELPDSEKQDLERLIAGDHFVNDAIEGLKNVKDKKKLQSYVNQLHLELHNHLQKKKLRREQRKLPDHPWIYFTILLILAICLIGYIFIRQNIH